MKYLVLLISFVATPLSAATLSGNPGNYTTQIAALNPGDTLQLAAGTYTNRLVLNGLHGNSGAWITIEGPATSVATFNGVSGNNTVSLRDCSYIEIKNITVDCLGLAVDGIKAEGYTTTPHTVHDMLVENVRILNAGNNQQIVGINTKCPCWNWTIRGCEIIGAGTGMYLGNSNGDEPFIRGVIEGNRVYDPEGYCIEIKHQNNWPAGTPSGNGSTIIRNNVFIKTSRASGSGDRPNLLFGGFPDSGTGSNDLYEVYGNFISSNPRESLIQATGRFTIHDNILVDAPNAGFAGVYVTAHQGKTVKLARMYNNTIYACGRGIRVASGSTASHVVGNLVFSSDAISGTVTTQSDNITDTVANATNYVTSPSITLSGMNFFPLTGQCTGSAISMTAFNTDAHYDLDFNGNSKGSFIHRGAYSGNGTNPGWAISNTLKTGGPGSGPTLPPALAIIAPAAGSLPNASGASSYTVTFVASGGAGGFTWDIPAIDVPTGLALNTNTGVLSGMPAPGNYAFTVTVTDANTDTASENYTLAVSVVDPGGGSGGGGGGGCSAGTGSPWWLLMCGAGILSHIVRRRRAGLPHGAAPKT
ncbi:MAG: Ig domain-containing protein [Planctomycetes bacterium]|nr:Ig domain-containing protein [Planctomycetota bacterium]